MGLLTKGTPLGWGKAKEYADFVRQNGIEQFLNIYTRVKGRERDCLVWGDELEYVVVKFDDQAKTVKLNLRAAEILETLEKEEMDAVKEGKDYPVSWKPEYARYMIEATPGKPYRALVKNLVEVEKNMRLRRKVASRLLEEGEFLLSVTNFPRLGCSDCFYPECLVGGNASLSVFIGDGAIAPHARFPTLTRNIRERRGRKVDIRVPKFIDTQTDMNEETGGGPVINMDCMCFGMGCCCLQITFQACNILEARHLYDQLAVMTPIMLSLTAATPIFRGFLADYDCRWSTISQSVDDRTEEELGLKPLEKNKFVINKSRYDSIDCYISLDKSVDVSSYNDLDLVYDKEIYQKLISSGIDDLLAKHMSHLFIRDPLVIYEESIKQDNQKSTDHFENIQSTNWQTMRFKPPPANSDIGWRVEFRSMEIQFTDFENAAFAIFIVLLTRAILSFGLVFYIPISKVDENMRIAHNRDSVLYEKFWFRKHLFKENPFTNNRPVETYGSPDVHDGGASPFTLREEAEAKAHDYSAGDDEVVQMSVNEIINEHLIPLIDAYLNSMNIDLESRLRLNSYLSLIRKRASGELLTNARWQREFVRKHKDYKSDSVVSPAINYDLCRAIHDIMDGKLKPKELL